VLREVNELAEQLREAIRKVTPEGFHRKVALDHIDQALSWTQMGARHKLQIGGES
jgi:hypothetical protein